MTPEEELAEFVEILWSRGKPVYPAIASMAAGVTDILNAFMDVQEKRGNWGAIMANCRVGAEKVRIAIEPVRKMGGPGFEGLVKFAEEQQRLALLMVDEIIRLQAKESTVILEFDRTPRDDDP